MRPGAGPRRGRLGDHSRAGAAAGRTDHRQAGQGIVLRHRPRTDAAAARHREHRADRHHHRCLRPHHHAGGQRPRFRMRVDRGLLCGHRQEQTRPRAANDTDAGRCVRRRRDVHGAERSLVMSIGETPMPSGALGVDAVAMTMRFGDFTALDKVELKVRPGSFHALLGENGAGNSTLVKCIMGYYHPTQGDVLVAGREQAIANPNDAHALGLGMVYQHFTLLPAMAFADAVTFLRRGKLAGYGRVADLTPDSMARMMIGAEELTIQPARVGEVGEARLELSRLNALDDAGAVAVHNVSLAVRGGEIVGIAGVSGNGQRQLVEVLAGQREAESGEIRVAGDIYHASREEMRRHKMSLLPAEPLKNACVGGMSVADNIAFREFDRAPFASGGWWLNRAAFRDDADKKIGPYKIKTPPPPTPISPLPGRNVQPAVLAREP